MMDPATSDLKRGPAILLLAGLLVAGMWAYFECTVNPRISFLSPGPGQWIVYPMPPQVPPLAGIPMTAIFRRSVVLPKRPTAVSLKWRCFQFGTVGINSTDIPTAAPASWKEISSLDATTYFHTGSNQIAFRVVCGNGLPALSLELTVDGARFVSDSGWESSLAGAVWRPAQPASETAVAGPGNWLYGAEDLGSALGRCWPLLVGFAMVAALASGLLARLSGGMSRRARLGVLAGLAVVWLALFLHNLPLLPPVSGFDASAHLEYMRYLQEHKSLPKANEGWEFFQAPLYYIVGAATLGLAHVRPMQPEAGQILGLLNMALGAIMLTVVWSALRLFFPGRTQLWIAGLLVAAFLPAQVYTLHYPTNEALSMVTTTAAIWLCLILLRRRNAEAKWYAWLGILLAITILAKATGFIALVAVLLILPLKARAEGTAWRTTFWRIGLCGGLCLLVGGWHYAMLWKDFGNPFIGNWDPALFPAWWQQPGYRTFDYYLRFGQALFHPLLSGLHSFWDGLYSTWWGDGLIGGTTRLYGRAPWNYDLVTVGYVLALAPSALILTGLWRAAQEGIRGRKLEWLFLVELVLLYGLAIFAMTLKVPSYSQSRAMYALPVILPVCVLGALGLDYWAARLKQARLYLLTWLGVWLLTVYASFWIRPDAPATRLAGAIGLFAAPGQDPAPAFEKVLAVDPHCASAIVALGDLDRKGGHLDRAMQRLKNEAKTTTNAIIDTTLAFDLAELGRMDEALGWAERGCATAPDYARAASALCSLSLRTARNEQAVRAGQLALRSAPQDAQIHLNVGLALVRLKRFAEAADYFTDALNAAPATADAHFWLGIALWNLPGRQAEARNHIAAAVGLSPRNEKWKLTLEEMERTLQTR